MNSAIVVSSDRSAELALVANHFISQFQGEQQQQCEAALNIIAGKNPSYFNDLSLGLKGFVAKALLAAYQQGYAECRQSAAGEFHLNVEVELPTIIFAVKFNRALKFAIQTAYALGRKHGKADQQTAIAPSECDVTPKEIDEFGLWLWAKLLHSAYYCRLAKEQGRTDSSIHAFDTTLFIYCRYRFNSENLETIFQVGLFAEKLVKTWNLNSPLPDEPSQDDL